jgi:hypothetical protein
MTPKEKAEELLNKFFNYCSYEWWEGQEGHKENMKQCALIAVEELINEVYSISHQYTAIYDDKTKFYNYTESKELKFWQEVKNEIKSL